jgi:MFS family permease
MIRADDHMISCGMLSMAGWQASGSFTPAAAAEVQQQPPAATASGGAARVFCILYHSTMGATAVTPQDEAAAEELRQFLYMFLGVLLVGMAIVQYVSSQGPAAAAELDSPTFKTFQRNYLFVYCWMVAGDWLQGPYVYHLYDYYGYGISDIGVLFIAGFGASMAFGTFIGSMCDKAGRRKGCIGYAVIYSLSCVTKHAGRQGQPDPFYFWVLMFGRILGGVATSLLFSSFDSWMVTEHKSKNFPDSGMSQTYSRATIANGMVAVSCGFVGQYASDFAGPVAPFDTAIIAMTVGGAVIAATWSENFGEGTGDSSTGGGVRESVKLAYEQCKADPTIVAACMLQSFFESAMYTFVFMWTPAMESRSVVPPNLIPFGLIFAAFMTSMMLGSSFFGFLAGRDVRPEKMMSFVLAGGIVSMVTVVMTESVFICLLCFCFFEGTCGIYFPAMGMLKAEYIPDNTRSVRAARPDGLQRSRYACSGTAHVWP